MLDGKYLYLLLAILPVFVMPIPDAVASSNPNLFVSAENSQFENHFSGSMVVEVVVYEPNMRDLDRGRGEPDVTLNGKSLRMVQATDGHWYAYFANVKKAKIADSTVGLAGEGLDFGVFCSRDTPLSVLGIAISETDGVAVPQSGGLAGFTNGDSSFALCTGSPSGSENLNNIVRKAKSINTNSNVPAGQIGLDSDAWPLIQLYSFGDVTIRYNPAGSSQQVSLEYDDIPNISTSLDRDVFPNNSEVFLTINDFQLNQDPTDEDSWTFDIDSNPSTFYQAYDRSGSSSANGGPGLVNLVPSLSRLGFDDNGKLFVNLSAVLELQSNDEQPATSITDGTDTFAEILTLVEDGPNSGIFDSGDNANQSTLGILANAPRGQGGIITYNKQSISVLTGTSTATISVPNPSLRIGDGVQSLKSGTEFPVVLVDPDQNLNSDLRDDLDVFRDSAIIPTLRIGSPVTLEQSSDVELFLLSTGSLDADGDSASSFVPDTNSARLIIDTSTVDLATFEKISINLGITASELYSLFIDTSLSNHDGTNWLNYDLRSFANDLGISDFTDTTMELYFGTARTTPVKIVDSGDFSSSSGMVRLADSGISSISDKSGTVYLVINFDSSNDDTRVGSIPSKTGLQPVMLDFFSFGVVDSDDVNNAIYRFELEETSRDSATFDGTLEYSIASHLDILDPLFIQAIRPISDKVKFIVTGRSVDDEGISISYSDLDVGGDFKTASTKSDIDTASGVISTNSKSYRFGQSVKITLNDPDLNLKNDIVDIYFVINDPGSANVDTVGKDRDILLEVLLKDIRYKRCTVNGVERGGLGSTGFTLAETGPSTGIFEGTFKMPSTICNKSGTKLISSAGGSLDVKYYDSHDASGNSNVFSMLKSRQVSSFHSPPQLSAYEIKRPLLGEEEIVLSGSIGNHKRGVPLAVTVTYPDGKSQSYGSPLASSGSYKSVISVNESSLPGVYNIELSYDDSPVGTVSFVVSTTEIPILIKNSTKLLPSDMISDSEPIDEAEHLAEEDDLITTLPLPPSENDSSEQRIPDWIKNNAERWPSDMISDSEFIDGIKYLAEAGIITPLLPPPENDLSEQHIPDWIKNIAKWWADDLISDEDFVKSVQYLVKKGIILV